MPPAVVRAQFASLALDVMEIKFAPENFGQLGLLWSSAKESLYNLQRALSQCKPALP
jgi:hypothetical protein